MKNNSSISSPSEIAGQGIQRHVVPSSVSRVPAQLSPMNTKDAGLQASDPRVRLGWAAMT